MRAEVSSCGGVDAAGQGEGGEHGGKRGEKGYQRVGHGE
jgi:hypothetical protein